jgi:hypothetical protein
MKTNIYLDCEFTEFHGQLLSIALVPEVGVPFYAILNVPVGEISPWSLINVVPKLKLTADVAATAGSANMPTDRESAARAMASWLFGFEQPNIIADWPEDFSHFLRLLTFRPGMSLKTPDLTMEYRKMPDFNASKMSKVPHNALHDAIALRDYCIKPVEPTPAP